MHLTDEQLILHYYGEAQSAAVAAHLQSCPACAQQYRELAATLSMMTALEVPERDDRYGLEVWQRIRHQLPAKHAWWPLSLPVTRSLQLASVAALLLVAAFIAGRHSTDRATQPLVNRTAAAEPQTAQGDSERVRLAALADHLEQSERVLLDVANAEGRRAARVDVSAAQGWAADLVDTNRLYREAAVQAGDAGSAAVLDDLERSLLDIVHAPAQLTPAQLEDVRTRIDAAALLFKVRVLSRDLREQHANVITPRKTT